MWDKKFSLFPEHLISLSLRVHDFACSLYLYYIICQSCDGVYVLIILVCLPGLV